MSECYNCGKELFSDSILGYLNGTKCNVCHECAESDEFVKSHYNKNELYMRFQVQYNRKGEDPSIYHNDLIVAKDIDDGLELARNKFSDCEIIGLMFDEYCTINDVTLMYNDKLDIWEPQIQ